MAKRKTHNDEQQRGKKYGRLQPLRSILKGKNIYWECKCDCGKVVIKRKNHLISGATTSCGCFNKEALLKRHVDANEGLIGTEFGRLTVKERSTNDSHGASRWLCTCICGKTSIVLKNSLLRGTTNSCGCLSIEKSRERIKQVTATFKREGHPNWNPNLTDEDRIPRRRIPGYQAFVKEAMVRDDYTCQVCKQHGGDLAVHHLNSYAEHTDQRTTLSNGITLCKECHSDFHTIYGYGNATSDDFNKWLETKVTCK